MTARDQKVIRAAKRMMKERGHVIIGVASDAAGPIRRGDITIVWAGAILPEEYVLRIEGRASRAQWTDQLNILFPGKEDPNVREKGQRFYRAALESLNFKAVKP